MGFVPDSAENVRAFLETEDIAARAGQTSSSAHLLLALFTFPNRAQVLLNERGIDEERILREIRVMEDEPKRCLNRIRERAREIARSAGNKDVNCLHILIAITRLRDSFAYKLLESSGLSLTSLRNVAVSYVTGNMPRRYRTLPRAETQAPIMQRRNIAAPKVLEREVESTPATTPAKEAEEDAFEAVAEAVQIAGAAPSRRWTVSSISWKWPQPWPAVGWTSPNVPSKASSTWPIGRERELEALIDVLGKRRSNNHCW